MSDVLIEMLVDREIPGHGLKTTGDRFHVSGDFATQLENSGYAKKTRKSKAPSGGVDPLSGGGSTKGSQKPTVAASGGDK